MILNITTIKKNKRIKETYYRIQKRTMINSRCFVTAKTAFNCLSTLTSKDILDTTTTDNQTSFNTSIGKITLNSLLGTPQHKRAILGHMLNHKLNTKTLYSLSAHNDLIKTTEAGGPGSHIITELATSEAYLTRFRDCIKEYEVTSDTKTITDVDGQKQTNFDFIVSILGLKQKNNFVTRIQDCKEGGGILRHSTRGSIGIITFDKNGNNIQTTPTIIDESMLLSYNRKRLESLEIFLETKKIQDIFIDTIIKCKKELNSGKSIFDINKTIEDILWNEVQRNPVFPRSVSFVFLQKVDFDTSTHDVSSQLRLNLDPSRNALKPYNLDKKGDMKEYYTILLKVYKKEVDPLIYDKLKYLQLSGIQFNTFFLDILNCIKDV